MALKYNGILLTAPTSATPFTANNSLWAYDITVTCSTGPAFVVGANGVQMAVLTTGIPFRFGHLNPINGQPLRLSDYSAQAAAGNVHIAYATEG